MGGGPFHRQNHGLKLKRHLRCLRELAVIVHVYSISQLNEGLLAEGLPLSRMKAKDQIREQGSDIK